MSTIPTRNQASAVRKPREERWSEILDAATELFYHKGYEGTSLQEIAEKLGIMKGSLYYYIRSKEDILFVVLNTTHQAGLENMVQMAGMGGTALDRLRNMIVGHIQYIGDNLIRTAVFLNEMKSLPQEAQDRILGGEVSYPKLFENVLREGLEEGTIKGDLDPRLTATIVLGSLNSTYRWLHPERAGNTQKVADYFSRILITGLKSGNAED